MCVAVYYLWMCCFVCHFVTTSYNVPLYASSAIFPNWTAFEIDKIWACFNQFCVFDGFPYAINDLLYKHTCLCHMNIPYILLWWGHIQITGEVNQVNQVMWKGCGKMTLMFKTAECPTLSPSILLTRTSVSFCYRRTSLFVIQPLRETFPICHIDNNQINRIIVKKTALHC